MSTGATDSALHETAFARIADIDTWGVVAVADTRGTPLYESATALLPGARALAVLGMEIFPEVLRLVVPEKEQGEAAARDLYGPHLDYLNGRLNRGLYDLARAYRHEGHRALPLPSQGTPSDPRFLRGILSFKHAAERAGLGRIGWSSLVVSKRFGPRVRLACLLTDAEIAPSPVLAANPCDGCGKCVDACPAGAVKPPGPGQDYVLDRFACASFRQGAGCCSTCQSVCPVGRI